MKNPIASFFASDTAPGILLCVATLLALFVENSGLSGFYEMFQNIPVTFRAGEFIIDKPLLLWINDGLMAIFFLLVGLEIKREILEGHLSQFDQLALPSLAAVGGLVVPALIYVAFNANNETTLRGWAIPAATDIAFALGVLVMLGKRVPASLKVCLVAVAIIDDLAAIIIIAVFYTAETSLIALALAGFGLAIVAFMNFKGVSRLSPYLWMGVFIWACVLKSGVHATLAGVALGLLIPMQCRTNVERSPLKLLEHALHPFVVLFVLPVFAFANAGVSLAGVTLETFMNPVTMGILFGLFVGKQLGIMGITFAAVKIGWVRLPEGVNWGHYYGMALLTGIGFTMSLFIGTLAFDTAEYATAVRLGVLSASVLSGVAGVIVLLTVHKKQSQQQQPVPTTE